MTNPIFEQAGNWDLLCDIGTGRMVVHKDININWPVQPTPMPAGMNLLRTGTLRGEVPQGIGSEEDIGRASTQINVNKSEFSAKADSSDNIFIDDVSSLLISHLALCAST